MCQEVVELITAYLDGALDPSMRSRFEEHLKSCDGCATYLEELRVTVATLGTLRDEHLDPVFRARLMNAFSDLPMTAPVNDESPLIAALRRGDRDAFAQVVDKHTPALLRVARGYVPSHAIAEEVVQDTWIALVKGIDNFEGRSSLQTWLFAVMCNIAKTRGVRERRDRDALLAATGATVDPTRFHGPTDPGAGSWKEPPTAFPDTPEGSVLGQELRAVAQTELDKLPGQQGAVVTLRDLLGFDSADVCRLLDLSVANQRVLLHRGRAAIRHVLEDYLTSGSTP